MATHSQSEPHAAVLQGVPPLITLEEHFVSPELFTRLSDLYSEQLKHLPKVANQLRDLGSQRLANMDENGISIQVISHAPGLGDQPLDMSRLANDEIAEAVRRYPTRFAGLAALPMSSPGEAADELRRSVRSLGLKGALVDAHVGGCHFNDRRFWPVFAAAVELDVPIYLHPTYPPPDRLSLVYQGDFPPQAARSLGSSAFGWHQDTGLSVLKLFAAGVFDEYPTLKIIVGHFGEMLPFMRERVEKLSVRWGPRTRSWGTVYDENIWITTSGVWSVAPMACILRNTKIDRILYSVDYPFEQNENGLRWIRDLQASGLVDAGQLEMIAYRNAQKLLGLDLS